jgi:hypothetical protein
MFFGSKAKQIDNAQIEGEDLIVEEPPREQTRVPVSFDTLYNRLNLALMPYAALVAIAGPQQSVLDEPTFEVFRADLFDGGKVTKIDLVKEATKAGVLEDCETAIPRWTNWPVPR